MKLKQLFKIVLLFTFIFLYQHIAYSQKYKEMINDNSINFYDVIKEAESYFKTIDVTKKGTGYKQFMRWAVANEHKYYPSGDRLSVDPEFAIKAYKKNMSNRVEQLNSSSITCMHIFPPSS